MSSATSTLPVVDVAAPAATVAARSRLRHVAVLGAAGGLGEGILAACREQGVGYTAIVRSRPERIANLPAGSGVVVAPSLGDVVTLASAFAGADAVITALGVTATSCDATASLAAHMASVERAMQSACVDRIVMINTLLASAPGAPAGLPMRFFASLPGRIGIGAREQQAVVDALGRGAFSSLRWTLVRGGLNARGSEEAPVDSADWCGARNSWMPVSYRSMGLWLLDEAAHGRYVRAAPLVSRGARG